MYRSFFSADTSLVVVVADAAAAAAIAKVATNNIQRIKLFVLIVCSEFCYYITCYCFRKVIHKTHPSVPVFSLSAFAIFDGDICSSKKQCTC
jgi:hypothetical protein